MELQEEASVAELKEVVGSRQGVSPEELRVLFAGRELQSSTSLQGCDLPEQSTVHVVHPPPGSSSSQLLLLQEHLSPVREKEQSRLTRLDLGSSRLPATSSGLAVILEANVRGGQGGATGGEVEQTRGATGGEEVEQTRGATGGEEVEQTRGARGGEVEEKTRGATGGEEVEKTRGATGGEEVEKTRGATGGEEGCANERVQRSELQAEAQKDVRTCSTFFVYCKSCGSIQPGKLRVRCWVCKETTLTLSRILKEERGRYGFDLSVERSQKGPSCWDDVLLPGRIHGLCQADGCHGNTAEFYMKCASHPTSEDDTSVTLDLIMMNSRNVPCIACTDIMEVVLVFQCAARHVICLDCFCRYCQTRLNERQFVYHSVIGYSLPCAAGCEDSLIKELHHFRILGDEQYGRYQQYGAEECLLTLGGLLCPSPGCGAGLLPPNGIRRVECDRQLGCGFTFCRNCRGPYHEGACEVMPAPPTRDSSQGFVVAEEASQRGRWDRASLLLIQESTKRCPRCSVPVERNGGCMHMQCSLCRAEWCWLCGVPWNRECMGNHWFG